MQNKEHISFSSPFFEISADKPNTSTFEEPSQKLPLKYQAIEIRLTPEELLREGYERKKKLWTQDQDKRLMELLQNKKLGWSQIAEKMPGRTQKMCYSRFRRLSNKLKENWTNEENQLIRSLFPLLEGKWKGISKYFPNRNAKQIQDHYQNYLRPQINKDPWTFEEDLLLIKLMKEYGKNWNQIGKSLKGRPQSQIKNRYYGRLKRMEEKKQQKYQKEIKTQIYE